MANASSHDLPSVIRNFRISGTIADAQPYGSGHINETFLVTTKEDAAPDYILQRVNHIVFKNVPKLMDNIARVTKHVGAKITASGGNPDRETLTLISASDGKPYALDGAGNFWRIYLFIDNTRSYDIVKTPAQAYEGGKMFGSFQRMLADIPGEPLFETIKDFHNIEWRLSVFEEKLQADVKKRASSIAKEIDIVRSRAEEMKTIFRLGREGVIPTRVTHNDTKFNNVLLDMNDKGLCVIDLDTVMPGHVHYDFGDSMRTATNTAAEDEKDLSKVEMNIAIFEAYAKGFLEETKAFLVPAEIDHLALSAKLMPFIIGLRFLTDYLDGDNYFKIHRPEHNIDRARAQFKLLQSMERQFSDMKRIVSACAK